MKTLLCVALLTLASPSLEARMRPHVIGGRDARLGEFPHQGSLQYLGAVRLGAAPFSAHSCGCALVSASWVLTAAHCVGPGAAGLFVVLGLHELGNQRTGAPVGYYIAAITSHPGWDMRTVQNDVAMVRLLGAARLSRYVQPVAMHEAGSSLDGARCTISGWGVTATGGGPLARVLQAANVDAISVTECQTYWPNSGKGNICVWAEGARGACNGDSGGPCVCNGRLAGLTSFGQRGCYTNTPSVYVRISEYRDWIKQVSGL